MQQLAESEMESKRDEASVRVTASLTKEHYRVLRALAAQHKVSVAWLVRYAVGQLVDKAEMIQLPLDLDQRR